MMKRENIEMSHTLCLWEEWEEWTELGATLQSVFCASYLADKIYALKFLTLSAPQKKLKFAS